MRCTRSTSTRRRYDIGWTISSALRGRPSAAPRRCGGARRVPARIALRRSVATSAVERRRMVHMDRGAPLRARRWRAARKPARASAASCSGSAPDEAQLPQRPRGSPIDTRGCRSRPRVRHIRAVSSLSRSQRLARAANVRCGRSSPRADRHEQPIALQRDVRPAPGRRPIDLGLARRRAGSELARREGPRLGQLARCCAAIQPCCVLRPGHALLERSARRQREPHLAASADRPRAASAAPGRDGRPRSPVRSKLAIHQMMLEIHRHRPRTPSSRALD